MAAFPFAFDTRLDPYFWDLNSPNTAVPYAAREAFRRQELAHRASSPRRLGAVEARDRTRRLSDLDDLRDLLRENVAEIARDLLGEPNRALSKPGELRFGSRGSVKVNLTGPYQGTWKDFENNQSGDLLALVQRERGLDFRGAVSWARDWLGIPADPLQALQARQQTAAEAEARRMERESRDAADEAAQAQVEASRIADARARWARSIAIDGSFAERYLIETRAIPKPSAGWPDDVIRFDRGKSELLFAVRDEAGEITAVQRIKLTMDLARRALKRGQDAKRTCGLQGNRPVVLPGDPAGPVVIAEGPETALSGWSAVGFETWAMLGSIAKAAPPAGRTVLLLRENDKTEAASRRKADEAVAAWRQDDIDVREVWPTAGHKDLNDQLQADGIEAIRAAILAVLEGPDNTPLKSVIRRGADGTGARKLTLRVPLEPRDLIVTVTADEARAEMAEAMKAFETAVGTHDTAMKRYGEGLEDFESEIYQRKIVNEAFEALSHEERLDRGIPFAGKLPPIEPTRPKPPVLLLRVPTGLGKSRALHRAAIGMILKMRAAGDTRSIVFAVPRHAVMDETVARLQALAVEMDIPIKAQPIRGREAEDPQAPGKTMCGRPELVKMVQAAYLNTSDSVCQQNRSGATPIQCPLFADCKYQQQFVAADIYVIAHNSIFHPPNSVFGDVAAVFIDESPLDAALEGFEGDVSLLVDGLRETEGLIKGDAEASAKLKDLRRRLINTLDASRLGPLTRTAALEAGLTAKACAEAIGLEYQRMVTGRDLGIHPALHQDEITLAAKKAGHNRQSKVMTKVWQALAGFLRMACEPDATGRLELVAGDGGERLLQYVGIREVGAGFRVPTMIADATANAELLQYVWPNLRATGPRNSVATPHVSYLQVVDRGFANSAIAPKPEAKCRTDKQRTERRAALNNVRRLRAAIFHRWLFTYDGKPMLVIMPKRTKDAMLDLGPMPGGISLMNHGNVAGIDSHGAVRTLISIGRIQVPADALSRKAGALTGVAVSGDYVLTDARVVAHGAAWITKAWRHPDPVAEALRWQATEGNQIQALGRGRGVNRTADTPLAVEIWSDISLPELGPVETVSWDELAPSVEDAMISAGGWLENASDAVTCFPSVAASPQALRQARSDEREVGRSVRFAYKELLISKPHTPPLIVTEYRRAAGGAKVSRAVFLVDLVPDPRAWLEERIGSLAMFRVIEAKSGG